MDTEEIASIMKRIASDFTPIIPQLRLEFLSPEAFHARMQGKPLLAWEILDSIERPAYPLHSLPGLKQIIICLEEVEQMVNLEAELLRRPLVEGMILKEILTIAVWQEAHPDPQAHAEKVLRRHWPFQYAALLGKNLGPVT
jgi:hypothetical protein